MQDGHVNWDMVLDPLRWEPLAYRDGWGDHSRLSFWEEWINDPAVRSWVAGTMKIDPPKALATIQGVGPQTAQEIHQAAWAAAWRQHAS